MPKRAKRAKVNQEPIILVDNPMKARHAKPDPDTAHGLCLANPCRVLVVGGCGASKTTTVLNCIARGAMWKPWDGGIYLMAPTKDVQQGEYVWSTRSFSSSFRSSSISSNAPAVRA